jgi:hypothetical protein
MGGARQLAGQGTPATIATAARRSPPAAGIVGDTDGVIRRRLTLTGAVLAGLVGEWLGHSLAYYRLAGLAGLQAGLTSGVHSYMLLLGAVLLATALIGAAAWSRAWVSLGRRIDSSAAVLAALRRGRAGAAPLVRSPPPGSSRQPTFAARVAALALPLTIVQCLLFLIQENVERALHGLAAAGLAPLVDAFGAAVWIQAAVALVLATVLVAAAHLLRAREATARRWAWLARSMWRRLQRAAHSPEPTPVHVAAALRLLGSALWQRPPPVSSAP